jgi:predicted nucleotidyltransferase
MVADDTRWSEPDDLIREMARRIIEQFHPLKIILFGSFARGGAGPDSDADLLVVMPPNGSRRELAVKIDLALFGIPLPADIVVVAPEDVERGREQVGSFLRPALREGRVLYERGA